MNKMLPVVLNTPKPADFSRWMIYGVFGITNVQRSQCIDECAERLYLSDITESCALRRLRSPFGKASLTSRRVQLSAEFSKPTSICRERSSLRARRATLFKKDVGYITNFMIFILLFAGLSFASPGFVLSIDESISADANTTVYATINITSDSTDTFLITAVSEKPWLTLQNTQLAVSSGDTKSTRLYFSPMVSTPSGTYKFTIVAESLSTKEKKSADILVNVFNNFSFAPEKLIEVDKISITGSLEPAGTSQMEIYFRNVGKEKTTIELVALVVSPSGRRITEVRESFLMGVNEMKAVERAFPIGDCAEHGEYNMSVAFSINGRQVFYSIKKFDVMKEAVMKVSSSESGLVTYEKTYYIENAGNKAGTTTLEDKITGSVFFSGTEPSRKENGMYSWDVSLGPCQKRVVRYKLDYSPIIMFALLVLAAWYILFKFRTFRVRKFIMQRKTIERGAEFTVGIDMKSYINARNVVVKDFVPSVFEVRDMPGLKPQKVKSHSGTELIWSFPEIKRNEERVLDYKVVPIFGVHGRLHLPRAHVTFDYMLRRVSKKSARVGIGFIKSEEDMSKRLKEERSPRKKKRPYPKYNLSSFRNIFRKHGKEIEIDEAKKDGRV